MEQPILKILYSSPKLLGSALSSLILARSLQTDRQTADSWKLAVVAQKIGL